MPTGTGMRGTGRDYTPNYYYYYGGKINQNQTWCVIIGRYMLFEFILGSDYSVLL